jgi:hypothetical protein
MIDTRVLWQKEMAVSVAAKRLGEPAGLTLFGKTVRIILPLLWLHGIHNVTALLN